MAEEAVRRTAAVAAAETEPLPTEYSFVNDSADVPRQPPQENRQRLVSRYWLLQEELRRRIESGRRWQSKSQGSFPRPWSWPGGHAQ